ncbi:aromatic amino acid lyase [Pontixanthobacter aquaemixtae]|uniref:Uncharacterized protein n=1 Tax=Pontixanthobacter aquaemixtae TaxID=1958940 RepID=A0A844ZUN0_9SPHN|nr:aromatic amino acid lyase [Pontixanthobacter aquaemixtae]MXO90686.1 hypothetical protein [Pontixanthobacter aquaemixtae]
MMERLEQFLAAAGSGKVPEAVAARQGQIGAYRDAYLAAAAISKADGTPVYGLDVLPGHLSGQAPDGKDIADIETAIMQSHKIGSPPDFSAFSARAIHLAKLYAIAAGGTPVSQRSFDMLSACFEDADFAAAIPARASYSCGDVIPATHWLSDFLEWARARDADFRLQSGEAMALINGGFVQVGSAIEPLMAAGRLWKHLLVVQKASAAAIGALRPGFQAAGDRADGWMEEAMRFVSGELPLSASGHRVQPPVSVRAMPQVTESLGLAIRGFAQEIDRALGRPSSNPLLVQDEAGEARIAESGAFLMPELARLARSLTEALLLCASASVRRMQALTHPEILERAWGGKLVKVQMQTIQIPKLGMSRFELANRRYGASGGFSAASTSLGVEDLWTNGTDANLDLGTCIERVEEIHALEFLLARICAHADAEGLDEAIQPDLMGRSRKLLASECEQAEIPACLPFLDL